MCHLSRLILGDYHWITWLLKTWNIVTVVTWANLMMIMVLLYHISIHCHCMENCIWNIIQNTFFWSHTDVKWVPARPAAPNQHKPVWTSWSFQKGNIGQVFFFFFLTWNSSMVLPMFSSNMRQYAPILVLGSDASEMLPCEQWDTMTYRRVITQREQTQIQKEVWVSLDTPFLCNSAGATCLYCWRRKGQDCRG